MRPDDFGWGEQAHRDRALRVALAHSPQGRLAAVLAVQRWPDHFQGGDEVMQQVMRGGRWGLGMHRAAGGARGVLRAVLGGWHMQRALGLGSSGRSAAAAQAVAAMPR